MGRKLYAKGEGFNPTTGIDDVEGLREELDALKGGSGGGGGDTTAIERRLTTAEGEIDALQGDVAEQSEEIAAVGAKVNTLQGTDTGKSVRTIAAEETAKIVGEAPANYDTLKKIADYISSDAEGAAELRNKVNKNATDIATLQSTKASKDEAQGYATTAKNEAIAAAAADAQEKANTAENNANHYTDGAVDDLAKGQVATNTAAIASLQTAQTSLSATVKTNANNIATHTQQIANLNSNKLGKTEKAADSAKASVISVNGISPDTTYGTTAGIIQNTSDNPTGTWCNRLRVLHNNSAGYFTELAMPFNAASGLYYRTNSYGVVSEWLKIPYATEIPTLALQNKRGLIQYSSGSPISAGWWRIGKTTKTSQQGWAFRVNLYRRFNNNAGEDYTIDCAIGYASGSASNVYFTQVAGGIYNARFIDKIRVTVSSNSVSYIDIHIAADCSNLIEYLLSDAAEALTPELITDETATTYEFSTVNGFATSHGGTFTGDITAPKITAQVALPATGVLWYGASSGGLSSAFTGLSRNIHGSAFLGINASILDSHTLSMAVAHANIGVSGLLMYGNEGTYKNTIMLVTRPKGSAGEAFDPKVYARIIIRESGNVGIGTTSPSEKLDVAGNIKASGTMTATATYHSSDERLKTFEGDVEVDLEKLKALPKKYFHWTADADGKRQIGTSAQAVSEVYPELVSEDKDGYLSVNYAALSVVALKAIDQLAEQNAELERRLARIEKYLNIE